MSCLVVFGSCLVPKGSRSLNWKSSSSSSPKRNTVGRLFCNDPWRKAAFTSLHRQDTDSCDADLMLCPPPPLPYCCCFSLCFLVFIILCFSLRLSAYLLQYLVCRFVNLLSLCTGLFVCLLMCLLDLCAGLFVCLLMCLLDLCVLCVKYRAALCWYEIQKWLCWDLVWSNPVDCSPRHASI